MANEDVVLTHQGVKELEEKPDYMGITDERLDLRPGSFTHPTPPTSDLV